MSFINQGFQAGLHVSRSERTLLLEYYTLGVVGEASVDHSYLLVSLFADVCNVNRMFEVWCDDDA